MSDSMQLPVAALVVIRDPKVCRSVIAALEHLRFPYRLHSFGREDKLLEEPGTVRILGQTESDRLSHVPRPVVLLGPHSPPEKSAGIWRPKGSALVDLRDLTPASLLRSLVVSTSGTGSDFVARHLVTLKMFSRIPEALVHVFLRDPRRMTRLQDLRRDMHVPRAKAQALIRFTGRFERAEHLFAALRCATWAILMEQNFTRSSVEEYLGMRDASAVRRACRRAGIPAPHRGLRLNAFLG